VSDVVETMRFTRYNAFAEGARPDHILQSTRFIGVVLVTLAPDPRFVCAFQAPFRHLPDRVTGAILNHWLDRAIDQRNISAVQARRSRRHRIKESAVAPRSRVASVLLLIKAFFINGSSTMCAPLDP
jgi:hypothetical protein